MTRHFFTRSQAPRATDVQRVAKRSSRGCLKVLVRLDRVRGSELPVLRKLGRNQANDVLLLIPDCRAEKSAVEAVRWLIKGADETTWPRPTETIGRVPRNPPEVRVSPAPLYQREVRTQVRPNRDQHDQAEC